MSAENERRSPNQQTGANAAPDIRERGDRRGQRQAERELTRATLRLMQAELRETGVLR